MFDARRVKLLSLTGLQPKTLKVGIFYQKRFTMMKAKAEID
jgi:hypothetical protein